MKIDKFSVKACCGRTAIMFKIDQIIDKQLLEKFVQLGFKELQNYTVAGILYVQNDKFIITATMGSDRLSIKCRQANCENDIQELENILQFI